MSPVLAWPARAAALLAFMAAIGAFADWPVYVHLPPDRALIKLSFSHGAAPKGECRRRSAEEIAKLPPNMRRPTDCPRERLPVAVELDLDGRPLYRAILPPSGLAGDGPARAYVRFAVPPGRHELAVRLRDSARAEGFDHARTASIELRAGQNFVIDFRPETGGFYFR